MNKKLIAIIMMCSMFGMSGCNDSSQMGENSVPKNEWVDLRGTEVTINNESGVALCMFIPNGVTVYKTQGEIEIQFEDFEDFSPPAIKHHVDYKVGVSSVFIRPESSDDLNELKLRLLNVGETLIFSINGFDVYKSKVSDDKTSLKIINVEKAISANFYSGKLLREKYKKDIYLKKLITEISAITHNCTKE